MAKTDYRFDNIHLDYNYEVFFEGIKKFCMREEVPFRVDSDFIDDRGFNLDLSRKSSFVSGEASGKVHIVGYKVEEAAAPAEGETEAAQDAASAEGAEAPTEGATGSVELTFSCSSGESSREKCEKLVVERIINGAKKAIEGKTVEQMLEESRALNDQTMKDLIGEGKDKRKFIITALVAVLIIVLIAPEACTHGWF